MRVISYGRIIKSGEGETENAHPSALREERNPAGEHNN